MSDLAVKTKGNSSPQGKMRVYFSCCPEDFEACFETMCKDIFASQDCAVYYESDWSTPADQDELSSRLADMQLFIVAITSNFLFKDCRARSFEYGFAMEHHIPVIPIAMESGMSVYFSDRMNAVHPGYGDIQFLDRTTHDTTEIPYAEKLKSKLETILVGDKLAERVRAAFDAYIFLSYRKKDRVYAKELMKLIHRIPYCRDIAIWYDEFLVPGEGWNQAIAEAMAKSKLVTLAVTPSITEPGNFIIEHEYPDAMNSGKEIIPAELVPTDRDVIERLFSGMPSLVDGNNIEDMAKALQSIAIKENDASLEHCFLIGLAYLGGIDVERDTERALSMITWAADNGLPEAMNKLTDMFNTGDGTACDYNAAIKWKKRLVETLKNSKETATPALLAGHLMELSIMCMDLGRVSEAKEALKKAIRYAKENQAQNPCPESQSALADVYYEYSTACINEGNTKDAENYEDKDISIREELTAASDDTKMQLSLIRAYRRKADILALEKKREEQEAVLVKCLERNQHLMDSTDDDRTARSLTAVYYALGNLMFHENDLKKALEYVEKGAELAEHLKELSDYDSSVLGSFYSLLSSICKGLSLLPSGGDKYRMTNRQKAFEYTNRNLKLCEEMSDKTGKFSDLRRLADAYDLMYQNAEVYKGGGEYLEKERTLREKLAKESENYSDRCALGSVYYHLGLFRLEGIEDADSYADTLDGIYESYTKALDITSQLCAEHDLPETRKLEADIFLARGRVFVLMADLALQDRMKSADVQRYNINKLPDDFIDRLFDDYDRAAEIYTGLGDRIRDTEILDGAVSAYLGMSEMMWKLTYAVGLFNMTRVKQYSVNEILAPLNKCLPLLRIMTKYGKSFEAIEHRLDVMESWFDAQRDQAALAAVLGTYTDILGIECGVKSDIEIVNKLGEKSQKLHANTGAVKESSDNRPEITFDGKNTVLLKNRALYAELLQKCAAEDLEKKNALAGFICLADSILAMDYAKGLSQEEQLKLKQDSDCDLTMARQIFLQLKEKDQNRLLGGRTEKKDLDSYWDKYLAASCKFPAKDGKWSELADRLHETAEFYAKVLSGCNENEPVRLEGLLEACIDLNKKLQDACRESENEAGEQEAEKKGKELNRRLGLVKANITEEDVFLFSQPGWDELKAWQKKHIDPLLSDKNANIEETEAALSSAVRLFADILSSCEDSEPIRKAEVIAMNRSLMEQMQAWYLTVGNKEKADAAGDEAAKRNAELEDFIFTLPAREADKARLLTGKPTSRELFKYNDAYIDYYLYGTQRLSDPLKTLEVLKDADPLYLKVLERCDDGDLYRENSILWAYIPIKSWICSTYKEQGKSSEYNAAHAGKQKLEDRRTENVKIIDSREREIIEAMLEDGKLRQDRLDDYWNTRVLPFTVNMTEDSWNKETALTDAINLFNMILEEQPESVDENTLESIEKYTIKVYDILKEYYIRIGYRRGDDGMDWQKDQFLKTADRVRHYYYVPPVEEQETLQNSRPGKAELEEYWQNCIEPYIDDSHRSNSNDKKDHAAFMDAAALFGKLMKNCTEDEHQRKIEILNSSISLWSVMVIFCMYSSDYIHELNTLPKELEELRRQHSLEMEKFLAGFISKREKDDFMKNRPDFLPENMDKPVIEAEEKLDHSFKSVSLLLKMCETEEEKVQVHQYVELRHECLLELYRIMGQEDKLQKEMSRDEDAKAAETREREEREQKFLKSRPGRRELSDYFNKYVKDYYQTSEGTDSEKEENINHISELFEKILEECDEGETQRKIDSYDALERITSFLFGKANDDDKKQKLLERFDMLSTLHEIEREKLYPEDKEKLLAGQPGSSELFKFQIDHLDYRVYNMKKDPIMAETRLKEAEDIGFKLYENCSDEKIVNKFEIRLKGDEKKRKTEIIKFLSYVNKNLQKLYTYTQETEKLNEAVRKEQLLQSKLAEL